MAGGAPFTKAEDDVIRECHRARSGKGAWYKDAALQLNRRPDSIRNRWMVVSARDAGAANNMVQSMYSSGPLSLADVVKLWKIDGSVWEASTFQPNKWEIGAKHPESGEILTKPLYQTKVLFKRKKSATMEQAAKIALADIREDATRRNRVTKARVPGIAKGKEPCAAEVDLFDVHINKLAWAVETGQNYDSEIAEASARAAVDDLVRGADPFEPEKFILPIGNDFTNIDNLLRQTTGGTPQETDTRYHRMFQRGRRLASWMIHECAKIAPVEVVIVPGNHDELTAWTIGQVLEAEFTDDRRVTFQSGPKLRKYVEYGANLVGFTHGCDEPHATLPQIMAVEAGEAWARTAYREWHVGHLHKQKATMPVMIDDKIGVTVRIIRALSGTDVWHSRKGYVGGVRGAEAFIWKKSGGLRAHLYHTAA